MMAKFALLQSSYDIYNSQHAGKLYIYMELHMHGTGNVTNN